MEKVYTLRERWMDAFKDARYDLWDKNTLQIEINACKEFIEIYTEKNYEIEVEKLTLKVEYLEKIKSSMR